MARFTHLLAFIVLGSTTTSIAAQDISLRATGRGHTQRIYRGAFTPDGKTFVTGGTDRIIRVWNAVDGKERFSLPGHEAAVHGVGLSGGNLLVSAAEDGTIFLWDLAQQKKIGELPKRNDPIHSLTVSHNGKMLATGAGDWQKKNLGELRLWDVQKRTEIAELAGHRRLVLALAFSPDDRLLAAVDRSGDIRVWDVEKRETVVSLYPENPVGAVQFTPDGKRLITGDYHGRVTLWDTESWCELALVRAHYGPVFFLSCSKTCPMLATCGWGGKVKLWNLAQLEEQPPLIVGDHGDKSWMVAFGPYGNTLASAGEDRLVKFWNLPQALQEDFRKATVPPTPRPTAGIGPAHIALLASGKGDNARTVQDLSLVQLSGNRHIQLIERETIERVLREQKLSLSGLVEAGTAVRVGRILGADILGIIEGTDEANSGFVAFDAATGVRLHDVGFNRPESEAQAADVASGCRAALVKWQAGLKSLKTVCFLPARNADLPRHMDSICDALAAALERQLLHHPAIATLERKRLEGVAQERELSQHINQLLGSVLVLQVEFARRQKSEGMRAAITIRDNAGKLLHSIGHEVADPHGAGLLEPLIEQIHDALNTVQSEALVKRGRESRRFLRDAEILWRHEQYRPALQAAEAAWLLNQDDDARIKLAEYLLHSARTAWQTGVPPTAKPALWKPFNATAEQVREALRLARRGYQLLEAARPRLHELPDHGGAWSLVENGECFQANADFLRDAAFVNIQPADAGAADELREFRLLGVQGRIERMRELAERAGPAPKRLERLTKAMHDRYLPQLHFSAPDEAVLKQSVSSCLEIWLKVSQQCTLENFPPLEAKNFMGGVMTAEKLGCLTPVTSAKESGFSIMRALLEHTHPVLRLYGAHYQTRLLLAAGALDEAGAEGQYEQITEEAKRWIDRAPFDSPEDNRVALYRVLHHILDTRPIHRDRIAADYQTLVEFMVERKDVVVAPWQYATRHWVANKELHAKGLHLIRQMRELYDAPQQRLLHDPQATVRADLAKCERDILAAAPQLQAAVAVPWDRVTPLVDLTAMPEMTMLMAPTRHDNDVYVIAGGFDRKKCQPVLQLIRAALDGSAMTRLGKAYPKVKNFDPKRPRMAFVEQPRYVSVCAIDDEHVYAGTAGDGIYAFPRAGGDALRIGEKDGLPSLDVAALIVTQGKIVAFLEDGFLIVHDPTKKQTQVIASSRRTTKQSPFDNDKPFRVFSFVADPERNRIIFPLLQHSYMHPNNGAWEFNLKTQTFRRLVPLHYYQATRPEDGKFYMQHRNGQWIAQFDLAEDRFTLLQGRNPYSFMPQTPAGLPADFAASFTYRLYHHGYEWTASPFSRRAVDGGKEEYFGHVAQVKNRAAAFTACFELANDAELLLGDGGGVYLVHLKK